MLNQIQLIGNVGKDPEIKKVGESSVVNFSLATTETYKDKTGTKQTDTQWHSIQAWGALADIIAKYIKKGDKIFIGGMIKYRMYEKDGVKHYVTEIKADNMKMLGGNPNTQQQPEPIADVDSDNDQLPF